MCWLSATSIIGELPKGATKQVWKSRTAKLSAHQVAVIAAAASVSQLLGSQLFVDSTVDICRPTTTRHYLLTFLGSGLERHTGSWKISSLPATACGLS